MQDCTAGFNEDLIKSAQSLRSIPDRPQDLPLLLITRGFAFLAAHQSCVGAGCLRCYWQQDGDAALVGAKLE